MKVLTQVTIGEWEKMGPAVGDEESGTGESNFLYRSIIGKNYSHLVSGKNKENSGS